MAEYAGRITQAHQAARESGLDGWLLYDFRHSNPILWEITGSRLHSTRRLFLWLPARGEPVLLAHQVDAAHFASWGVPVRPYRGREDLLRQVRDILAGVARVAMEYSPLGALPTLSWVDGGTLEMVRSHGVEVASSAPLVQAALGRLTGWELASHRYAAEKLGLIVQDAFAWIGEKVRDGMDEYAVCAFIRERFRQERLWTDEGPIVAVNEHSGDPHYVPSPQGSSPIRPGDWVLIDLWARQEDGIFGDITWTAYVGNQAPEEHRRVFQVVTVARDMALDFIRQAVQGGRFPQGWEVDRVARDYIRAAGYGDAFTHRLGHSLGSVVHGYGANLDSFETQDVRELAPGTAFTIEPGIYLPRFGVRSEIDVYLRESGPEVTSPVQREVVTIRVR
ncbi:MAG: aminopeptidase P family protein [Chloroflexi bacterium]|nr:aminopeptidase P family protein [Chloroflexota bacterium]